MTPLSFSTIYLLNDEINKEVLELYKKVKKMHPESLVESYFDVMYMAYIPTIYTPILYGRMPSKPKREINAILYDMCFAAVLPKAVFGNYVDKAGVMSLRNGDLCRQINISTSTGLQPLIDEINKCVLDIYAYCTKNIFDKLTSEDILKRSFTIAMVNAIKYTLEHNKDLGFMMKEILISNTYTPFNNNIVEPEFVKYLAISDYYVHTSVSKSMRNVEM